MLPPLSRRRALTAGAIVALTLLLAVLAGQFDWGIGDWQLDHGHSHGDGAPPRPALRGTVVLDSELSPATPWRDNILRKRIDEPSGIVYHPGRDSLFVVGDDGRISEIDRDGRRLQRERLGDGDLEGITVDPASGLLYVAVEGRERVLEVEPDQLQRLREFDIERRKGGFEVFPKGGNGIEAIAFVPDPQRRHGGTFWVANQGEGRGDPESARLVEIALPLSDAGNGRGRILRVLESRIRDLSGLHYLPAQRRLALISDRQNLYLELSLRGEILLARSLPGHDQEGVAVDGDGAIYIAVDDDGHGDDAVMKLPPWR